MKYITENSEENNEEERLDGEDEELCQQLIQSERIDLMHRGPSFTKRR